MWLFTYGADAENVLSQTERDGLDSPCGKKKIKWPLIAAITSLKFAYLVF